MLIPSHIFYLLRIVKFACKEDIEIIEILRCLLLSRSTNEMEGLNERDRLKIKELTMVFMLEKFRPAHEIADRVFTAEEYFALRSAKSDVFINSEDFYDQTWAGKDAIRAVEIELEEAFLPSLEKCLIRAREAISD